MADRRRGARDDRRLHCWAHASRHLHADPDRHAGPSARLLYLHCTHFHGRFYADHLVCEHNGGMHQDATRPMNQQGGQLRVAPLADAEQLLPPPGAALTRHQAQEGRELPPGTEHPGLPHRGHSRGSRQQINVEDRDNALSLLPGGDPAGVRTRVLRWPVVRVFLTRHPRPTLAPRRTDAPIG